MTQAEQIQMLLDQFRAGSSEGIRDERQESQKDVLSVRDTPKSATTLLPPFEEEPFRDEEAYEGRYGK